MLFQLVPKSTTVDDFERLYRTPLHIVGFQLTLKRLTLNDLEASLPYLILPSRAGRLLHLPSAEAVSVRSNFFPRLIEINYEVVLRMK